ncbi:GatB/YqeY domain-containing protein, partial [Candidatus Pacearchaeota archaeon]|nr:GatB/YqeY domain-containing protein [Candidatus Pacearchaeota archaeon]
EVIKVVTTFIKNAKEMLGHLEDEDDKAVFEDEIETYQTYLPPQMSKEELTSVIINIMEVKEGDVTPTIGVVMKHLSANYSGKYDGKLASEIVRAYKQTNN